MITPLTDPKDFMIGAAVQRSGNSDNDGSFEGSDQDINFTLNISGTDIVNEQNYLKR